MTTPITRVTVGSVVSHTNGSAVANNAYCVSGDAVRIQNTSNALLADFRLTGVTFGTAPVAGCLQLAKAPRDLSGNIGPTPSATLVPTQVWTFGPVPAASNASTGWIMSIDSVPIDADADYWIYNNGTGYSLTAATIAYQLWSPGS